MNAEEKQNLSTCLNSGLHLLLIHIIVNDKDIDIRRYVPIVVGNGKKHHSVLLSFLIIPSVNHLSGYVLLLQCYTGRWNAYCIYFGLKHIKN